MTRDEGAARGRQSSRRCAASRFRGGGVAAAPGAAASAVPEHQYDGRFTFVRVSYETAPGGYWYGGLPAWAHGYPVAEQNLMKIMNEVSYLGANDEEINTLAWTIPSCSSIRSRTSSRSAGELMTDREAAALRAYLQKGGFVIVDDFKARRGFDGAGLGAFEANMQRVLPGVRFVDMTRRIRSFTRSSKSTISTSCPRRTSRVADLSRRVRGQRSVEAAADDRQLQHGHLPVLGMVGHGPAPDQ